MTYITQSVSNQIFKRDSTGGVRTWSYDIGTDGSNWAWRTKSGVKDGKIVTSGWKVVEQKNIGKVNETSLEQQAGLEADAEMMKKLERGYFTTLDVIDTFEKIKPMLATKHEDAKYDFTNNVYYSQPKLDGIRCIARKGGLWSRSGKEIVAVPHIAQELETFFNQHPNAILDGELYNHELKDDFNTITSLVRKSKPTEEDFTESSRLVQYHIYDMVKMDDEEEKMYQSNPFFSNRHSWIRDELRDATSLNIVETYHVSDQDQMDRFYGKYLESGYEGQMIRVDAVYEQNKRSKYLIKRKEFLTDEFKVVSIEEGKGNWAGYIKRFILELPDGTQFGGGVRGTQDVLKALFESKEVPAWATLRYFTPTPDGIPRFPVVIDWGKGQRED